MGVLTRTNCFRKVLRRCYYKIIFMPVLLQIHIMHLFHKKCIYFIATPIHGNLGDHAIVHAQYQLMEEMGLKDNVIEIYRLCYEAAKKELHRIIKADELIVIDGGGNLGTLWLEEDEVMRDVAKRFPSNPVLIFPQTAYYADTSVGRNKLQKSIRIYQEHRNLTIFCRDNNTYDLIKTRFKGVRSYYTPDIVLLLGEVGQQAVRNGVLLCFRDDLECMRPCGFSRELKKYMIEKKYDVKSTSTVIVKCITKRQRVKQLLKKWKEFSEVKLVVTDRLHGMIFSAITGTPCIALDNVSHKIKSGYEWIKFLPYIEYCDKYDSSICEKIDGWMRTDKLFRYDNAPLQPYFKVIKEEVKRTFYNEPDKFF